jgi:hypothetical protein
LTAALPVVVAVAEAVGDGLEVVELAVGVVVTFGRVRGCGWLPHPSAVTMPVIASAQAANVTRRRRPIGRSGRWSNSIRAL